MNWIVTEVDGKIASIAADYRHFAKIAADIDTLSPEDVDEVRTLKISTEELLELGKTLKWDDLRLFGSAFQIKVWETLFKMPRKLLSYTEFAALAENPAGVRAVAHAVALNPVAYVIPCHLVVPKESLDKVRQIRETAEKTLFKGSDLYLLDTIDVGEYAYGPDIKRELIKLQLA
jgi:O-6-methylguanine DNA methyltransferase